MTDVADHLLPEGKPLYTVYEAAKVLDINPATVWRLAKRGRVRLVKIGAHTRMRRDDLEALMLSHKT